MGGGGLAGIAPTVRAATERRLAGGPNDAASMPPARYTVEGTVEAGNWPNFQVDGYGTWLWALSEHVGHWGTKSLIDELGEGLELACSYLEAVALDPCYDCWEENGQAVHTSTLACVYGAFRRQVSSWGARRRGGRPKKWPIHPRPDAKRGRFAKSSVDRGVDASLLWLAVPFGLVPPAEKAMAATAAEIERALVLEGGIRRYGADSYYGGGAWPLLTAWLGWYRASAGDLVRPPTVRLLGGRLLRRRRPPPRAGRRRPPRPRLVPHLGRPLGPPGGRPDLVARHVLRPLGRITEAPDHGGPGRPS